MKMEVSKSMGEKKGNFFLVELVINCLIFTICAAVCLNLFVRGFQESKESQDLSMATLAAQNIAEVLKATNANEKEMAEAIIVSSENIIYYNENWENIQNQEGSMFTASINTLKDEEFMSSVIEISDKNGNFIYSLEVAKYIGGMEVSDNE